MPLITVNERAEAPKCVHCGAPAICIGRYEDCEAPPEHACDECCGHGCEDGHCDALYPCDDCGNMKTAADSEYPTCAEHEAEFQQRAAERPVPHE